jgi:hypothetical protein
MLSYGNSTEIYQFLKTLQPGGIRTRDRLSVGGRNGHYAMPPGQWMTVFISQLLENYRMIHCYLCAILSHG